MFLLHMLQDIFQRALPLTSFHHTLERTKAAGFDVGFIILVCHLLRATSLFIGAVQRHRRAYLLGGEVPRRVTKRNATRWAYLGDWKLLNTPGADNVPVITLLGWWQTYLLANWTGDETRGIHLSFALIGTLSTLFKVAHNFQFGNQNGFHSRGVDPFFL
jgi:hypothetical protein